MKVNAREKNIVFMGKTVVNPDPLDFGGTRLSEWFI
jgi:hypothetical protein